MHQESHEFQAEVSRLLDIVAHSLYSNKEIFLRELISNASDACDKLRYAALTQGDLLADDPELKIVIDADPRAATLSVIDNGVGMNRDDLVENLGTIARSGTAAFVDQLKGDEADMSLIGQFGVGFYAAFMVADRVEVTTRRAGEAAAWTWSSDGKGGYEIAAGPDDAPRGTRVRLHLDKDAREYLETAQIERIVKTYSDHIALPIRLKEGDVARQLNDAGALWMKPKGDVTDDQYAEFYHHVAHAFDQPWLTLHNRVEGVIEYASLVFVPTTTPFDLFHPERPHGIKLYVRRVFITDDAKDLVPAWLRFLKGVVDSEDLPLNISREMLQHNPVLAKIRAGLTKRVLGELKKKAEKAPDEYATFWQGFGAVLKEGLYEGEDHREALLALARFRSTGADGWTGLADYAGRMVEGQDEIYYLSGEDADAAARSPHLEGFRARGVEVLLLTDPIDEFWLPVVGEYEGKSFRSVTRGGIDLDGFAKPESEEEQPEADDVTTLVAAFKLALEGAVKDVRTSTLLTDSAVCLVADQGDMDMHLERMLRQHNQLDSAARRVLEINPKHPLIAALTQRLSEKGADAGIDEVAHLLLDQARIAEGEPVPDPAAFGRRLAQVLETAIAGG